MPVRPCIWLVILLAGCVSPEPSRTGVAWQSLKVDAEAGQDRILFDVSLVQRPIDDVFLNHDLWASVDEMILPTDLRENLELNGYRIGLLVGSPPDRLKQLLQSDRSCIERKGRSVAPGTLLQQNLRECFDTTEGTIRRGKVSETVVFDRPLFAFDLFPTLKQQSVRLRVTPRIETGERTMNFKPVPEESNWALEMKRPTRMLTDLAMEIDLAPNQLLIIGARPERVGTVGYQSFVDDQSGEILQRVLVLRHLQSRPANAEASGTVPFQAVSH